MVEPGSDIRLLWRAHRGTMRQTKNRTKELLRAFRSALLLYTQCVPDLESVTALHQLSQCRVFGLALRAAIESRNLAREGTLCNRRLHHVGAPVGTMTAAAPPPLQQKQQQQQQQPWEWFLPCYEAYYTWAA